MKKQLLSIPFLLIIGRSAGMLIPFVIARAYGAGAHTDAFFWVLSLMTFIASVMTYLFESVLVPYLTEHKIESDSADDFANAVLLVILPVVLGICLILGGALALGVLRFGPSGDNIFLARLFFEMTPFLLLGIWAAQSNGIFYTHQKFSFPALSPLFRSLTILCCIAVLRKTWGIHALAAGYVLGEGLRWGTGLLTLKRMACWNLRIRREEVGAEIAEFFRRIGYQLIALIAVNIIFFVDLSFAAQLGEGKASLFNYADRLQQVPYLLFQAGFLNIFYSFWAQSFQKESLPIFWGKIRRHTRAIFAVTFAVSFFLWLTREPLISIVYGRENFSGGQIREIQSLFGLLCIQLPAAVMYTLYVRVLFILKSVKLYLGVACFQLGGKIILNFIFAHFYGVQGLALSTLVVMGVLALALHGYLGQFWKERTGHAAS